MYLRLAVVVTLVLQQLYLSSSTARAADKSLAQIRQENDISLVFLNTKITKPTGAIHRSTGTGFLLTKEGYLLTKSHILSEDGLYDKYEIWGTPLTRYGHQWPMDVIKDDSKNDSLLLKFKPVGVDWKSVALGSPTQPLSEPIFRSWAFLLNTTCRLKKGNSATRPAQVAVG